MQWDATNSNGQQVSTGVYLYRIKADGFVETKKMVLLR
ncbi:MAG: T9SS type A sorting domain-containing protein [Candidatus Marinimicrobia bacterium]|nr:T9SS type A sorting domain-containing protein [Candidatus Neomarinimicrobiota bacterium]